MAARLNHTRVSPKFSIQSFSHTTHSASHSTLDINTSKFPNTPDSQVISLTFLDDLIQIIPVLPANVTECFRNKDCFFHNSKVSEYLLSRCTDPKIDGCEDNKFPNKFKHFTDRGFNKYPLPINHQTAFSRC